MAGHRRAAIVADDDEEFDTRTLAWLAGWGVSAVISVTAMVLVARTDLGALRVSAALAAIAAPPGEGPPAAAQLLSRTVAAERDASRAIETAQALSADRERMALRVVALERDIGDLAGSVQRAIAVAAESKATSQFPSMASAVLLTQPRSPVSAVWAPAPPVTTAELPPPAPSAPLVAVERPFDKTAMTNVPLPRAAPAAAPQTVAAAAPPPAAAAAKQPAATPGEPAAMVTASIAAAAIPEPPLKVDFGVDLGPALTMARLRARWNKLSAERPDMVKGLRPLVTVRETGAGKPVEIRLVVGPLASVNAATEFCSALTPTPQYLCRPAVFDGQRLTVQ